MIARNTEQLDGLGLLKRFIAKLDRHNECWVWTGATNSKGYPAFRVGSRVALAHRFSHEVFIGPIPAGEQVHHKCMNPLCVNPAHLESVTPEVNRRLQALGVGEEPAPS